MIDQAPELADFLAYGKAFAAIVAVAGFAFAGWNAHLQSKIASLGKLWEWKDLFTEAYNQNRLADAKEYASQAQLGGAIRNIEADMREMERRLEARLGLMDAKLDDLLKRK